MDDSNFHLKCSQPAVKLELVWYARKLDLDIMTYCVNSKTNNKGTCCI